MNQGRIWCVVHPTVGLPLLIGGVAVTSLIVHGCVLAHTSWFGNYWQGKAARTAMNTSVAPASFTAASQPGFSVSVNPVAASGNNGASFVVTVSPNSVQTAKAAAATPVSLAAK